MLAGIQLLVYYKLLEFNLSVLSFKELVLMILITIMTGAGGYVINDFYDAPIDTINKPRKWIAGNILSLENVKIIYLIIIFTGFGLSVWLAIRLDLLGYIFIYPIAVAALWLYSYSLKCKPAIGNIWVALFCAGVVGIVALPDLLLNNRQIIKEELWYYIVFAFLSTWLREVVKDIEDMEGDAAVNCRTAVVRFGIKSGKIMVILIGIILIVSLLLWDNQESKHWIKLTLTVLQGFTVGSMAMVWWAKNKLYYHHASTIIKLIMIGGTLMLVWV